MESYGSSSSLLAVTAAFGVAFAVAAWRWGFASFAGFAAFFCLVALAQGDLGRGAWLILGVAAAPLVLRIARSPFWPPAHRRCVEAAGLVLVAGAYVATNIYSLDHRWIEGLTNGGYAPAPAWARTPAIAGTILVPPLVLAAGIRFRHRALLAAGSLMAAASLTTLRRYHPVGPWWLALVLGGSACLALAVGLRRWLDAGPDHERWGFTAEGLFEDRRLARAVQAAATIVAMSPGPRPAAEPGFEGGGGRSGGGGATGSA
jgi:hypothetical protein